MNMQAPFAISIAIYTDGFASAANSLVTAGRGGIMWLGRIARLHGWKAVVHQLSTPSGRTACARWIAGASLAGVIVAGGPLVAAHTRSDDNAHDWRMRAKASLTTHAVGASSAAPSEAVARVRAVAAERHEAYAANNAEAWAPFHRYAPALFEDAVRQRSEHECLSRAVYYEARAESGVGQYAVAEVVLNRVRHRNYPNTVCDVVYEGSHRATGCQFTFTCDGSERRAPYGRAWGRAQNIAAFALMGMTEPVTGEATHYHADYVSPYWAPTLVKTETIGAHIFYRMPGRG